MGRIVGVVTNPRAIYTEVAAHPLFAGVLLILLATSIAATLVFFSTDVGQQALVDQLVRSAESFGRTVSEAQYERLQQWVLTSPYVMAAAELVLVPAALLLMSGGILAVFSVLGHKSTFRQTAAVVTHSGTILLLQQLVLFSLAYARESLSSPTNLAAFLPMLEEDSLPARLLGSIDLFRVWWIASVAVGLAVLYRRRATPIACGLFAIYLASAVAIAIAQVILSGA